MDILPSLCKVECPFFIQSKDGIRVSTQYHLNANSCIYQITKSFGNGGNGQKQMKIEVIQVKSEKKIMKLV